MINLSNSRIVTFYTIVRQYLPILLNNSILVYSAFGT